MKRIVLCADDYGQAEAISQGIITLIQNGRLSATSCLANSPLWSEHAKRLIPFKGLVDIGLHFNLTEGKALSKPFIAAYGEDLFPLFKLMKRSFLRKLDAKVIEAECEAQLDQFVDALGALPNFIDGHQHVHQFPIIRDAFIKVYEKRLRKNNAYVRLVNEKIKPIDFLQDFKKIIICTMGTRALKQLLGQHNIPHNQSFSGIYSFSKSDNYEKLFPRFLKEIGDKGIVMCHPGLSASRFGGQDAIAQSRYEEYQYLTSNQFLIDCHVHGVKLDKFNH